MSTQANDPFEFTKDSKSVETDKYRRAAQFVADFMKRSDEYRQPHLEAARRARELYVCWDQQQRTLIQRANLKLPYAYTVIQTEIPMLFSEFMKERPFVQFSGRNPPAAQFEGSMTDFQDSQINEMGFVPKFASICTALLIDGTAVAKVPYEYKEKIASRRVQKISPELGVLYFEKEDVVKVDFDGPNVHQIPLIDFFPDWSVKVPGAIQPMRGCSHRLYMTFNELKQRRKRKRANGDDAGVYVNIDELELSLSIKGVSAWGLPYYDSSHRDSYDRSSNNKPGEKTKGKLEVWEYWGLYDWANDGDFEECVITVVNGDVCVRIDKNPTDEKFKPFIASVAVVQDNEFYGLSEVMAVKGLIKEGQAIRNARLDQINLSINRTWLVHRASGIKTKNLYVRPNGIIHTNDMEGIRLLELPELPPSSFREVQEIDMDIQNATGQSSTPGQASTFNKALARSATGANMLNSFAQSRAGLKVKLLSELFFKPLGLMMFYYNKQFVTQDQWVKLSDPNAQANPFAVLPAEAFFHEYDLKTVADTGGAEVELQKYQTFATLAQAAEATQPGIINWQPVFQKIGRALLGPNVAEFIRSPQEMQQLQAQNLAMQSAVNGMQGARAPQPGANPQLPPANQGVRRAG